MSISVSSMDVGLYEESGESLKKALNFLGSSLFPKGGIWFGAQSNIPGPKIQAGVIKRQ